MVDGVVHHLGEAPMPDALGVLGQDSDPRLDVPNPDIRLREVGLQLVVLTPRRNRRELVDASLGLALARQRPVLDYVPDVFIHRLARDVEVLHAELADVPGVVPNMLDDEAPNRLALRTYPGHPASRLSTLRV